MRTRSQPPEEPQMARLSRKRGASTHLEDDAAVTTSKTPGRLNPLPSPPTTQPQARKKKRVARVSVDDREQLQHELDEATSPNVVIPHSEKSVRFSQDPDADTASNVTDDVIHVDGQQDDADIEASEVTTQTTHGQHNTLSSPAKPTPTKSRKVRHSLPARLETQSPLVPKVGELQFLPLKAVIDSRSKRRMRRSHLSEEYNTIEEHEREDVKIKQELLQLRATIQAKNQQLEDLSWELESQRQMSIDVGQDGDSERVTNLKARIAALQEENDEHRKVETSLVEQGADEDIDMDDELNLVDPADLGQDTPTSLEFEVSTANGTQTSHVTTTTTTTVGNRGSTQVSLPDPVHEEELLHYEEIVKQLNREIADLKSALQILTVELNGLGFGTSDNVVSIMTSIRTIFRDVRVNLEELLPEDTSDLSDAELLSFVVVRIRSLLATVDENAALIQRQNELYSILSHQNNGLIDKLAESQAHEKRLHEQWGKLDKTNEAKSKQILELEDAVEELEGKLGEADEQIEDMEKTTEDLTSKNTDLEKSYNLIKQSLEAYRIDLKQAEEAALRVEEEYKITIANLKRAHAQAIGDLQVVVETERSQRLTAEQDLDERTSEITNLQVQIETLETELDDLRNKLEDAQRRTAAEKDQREAAEEEIDQKNGFITDLEARIEKDETALEVLRQELQSLKALLESEKQAREDMEIELADREAKIKNLDAKIHDLGLEGNKLRGKLFEVQQNHEAVVVELETTIVARNTAGQQIEELKVEITNLEERLQDTTHRMNDLTAEKDRLLADQDAQIAGLNEQLRQADDEFAALKEDKDINIKALHDDIAILQSELEKAEQKIAILEKEQVDTAAAHSIAIEDRDSRIDILNGDVRSANDRIRTLEHQNAGLEDRVAQEAEQMLLYSDRKATEIDGLNATIASKDEVIADLTNQLNTSTFDYTATVSTLEEEVSTWKTAAGHSDAELLRIKAERDDLKERLRRQVELMKTTVRNRDQLFRSMLEESEVSGEAAIAVAEKDLIEAMEVDSTPLVLTNGGDAEHDNVAVERVVKKTKKVKKHAREDAIAA